MSGVRLEIFVVHEISSLSRASMGQPPLERLMLVGQQIEREHEAKPNPLLVPSTIASAWLLHT